MPGEVVKGKHLADAASWSAQHNQWTTQHILTPVLYSCRKVWAAAAA